MDSVCHHSTSDHQDDVYCAALLAVYEGLASVCRRKIEISYRGPRPWQVFELPKHEGVSGNEAINGRLRHWVECARH